MIFKRKLFKIVVPLILTVLILVMSTHTAHAGLMSWVLGSVVTKPANAIIGLIAWIMLTVAGFVLSATGILLNISMYLTTHIGLFLDETDAVYTVWGIIRDLSSILLIFFILYASLQMIIGVKSATFGTLMKNIIIVGVLINFSFFFTRVMIDASNIVSLQFYNAIATGNTASSFPPKTPLKDIIPKLMTSGGVSDTIMGQLNINAWWAKSTSGGSPSANISAGVNMIIVALGGVVVSLITSLSFIVISLVALVRIGMLIFLIGFSPIWVASWAMPELKSLTSKWTGPFYASLIFLPVYLAFLYVALRVITELQLNKVASGTVDSSNLGNAINLLVGFSIVIVMLGIPPIAAAAVTASLGGDAGMLTKFSNKTRAWVGSKTKSTLSNGAQKTWTGTGSRFASSISDNKKLRDYSSQKGLTGAVSRLALKSSRKVGAGYNKDLEEKVKTRTQFAESLGHDEEKVTDMEKKIRDEKKQISESLKKAETARSAGDILAAEGHEKDAAVLKKYMKTAEDDIEIEKNRRKVAYSESLKPEIKVGMYDKAKVTDMEKKIRDEKKQISESLKKAETARSAGDFLNAEGHEKDAAVLKKYIKTAEDDIKKEKSKPRDHIATLWAKLIPADPVAAAQISVKVWEQKLISKKKVADDAKGDLKRVEYDIQRAGGRGKNPALDNLQSELKEKLENLSRNPKHGGDVTQMGTDDLQDLIDQAKLVRR